MTQPSNSDDPSSVPLLTASGVLVEPEDVRLFSTLLWRFSQTLESVERARAGIPYELAFLPRLLRATKAVEFKVEDYLALAEWRYELYLQLIAEAGGNQLIPPWDVAVVFLCHLMQPARFLSDTFRRVDPSTAPLSRWNYPLLELAKKNPGEIDVRTERLWGAKYGSEAPFELYRYDADGHVSGMQKGNWAAKAMITSWVPQTASQSSSKISRPATTAQTKQSWRKVKCDINVWSRIRTGAIDLSWLDSQAWLEAELATLQGIGAWTTWRFQLGGSESRPLLPSPGTIDRIDSASKTRRSFKVVSSSEDKEALQLQQDLLRHDPAFFEQLRPDSGSAISSAFPCISVDLVAAAKGLPTLTDQSMKALGLEGSPAGLLVATSEPQAASARAVSIVDSLSQSLAPLVDHNQTVADRQAAMLPEKGALRVHNPDPGPDVFRSAVNSISGDVDIAWRAALVKPSRYLSWCVKHLGGFLDLKSRQIEAA